MLDSESRLTVPVGAGAEGDAPGFGEALRWEATRKATGLPLVPRIYWVRCWGPPPGSPMGEVRSILTDILGMRPLQIQSYKRPTGRRLARAADSWLAQLPAPAAPGAAGPSSGSMHLPLPHVEPLEGPTPEDPSFELRVERYDYARHELLAERAAARRIGAPPPPASAVAGHGGPQAPLAASPGQPTPPAPSGYSGTTRSASSPAPAAGGPSLTVRNPYAALATLSEQDISAASLQPASYLAAAQRAAPPGGAAHPPPPARTEAAATSVSQLVAALAAEAAAVQVAGEAAAVLAMAALGTAVTALPPLRALSRPSAGPQRSWSPSGDRPPKLRRQDAGSSSGGGAAGEVAGGATDGPAMEVDGSGPSPAEAPGAPAAGATGLAGPAADGGGGGPLGMDA
ncbi:hypothetical protein HYH03_018841 [Edaphochlamys debaryana]|uniref:Uncharacterized protein n=1 Tax=Edaphochlamys debaryana TaxID=47281 RepID=A0A836BMR0_9CHLO|nr:hypothetical protein HYH03_018841 [Edaphochlamys debaryana]|eukprot:KAG2482215.1 hypothetical protein HYH03_018841 [Edaphochlamys debaryana]